ncbi:pantetheine-phosphate adenylyltransferase [Candidatus Epulonipiscium viviparus]|uniref:pantetheine-phosphate adenylyltransferase n=1 Tax=Candidatus Epulonipiscium viviparus TaxID=420336 RepID=UPI00016C0748|nr:pantetheine-phosphate adenylyltransferase [Candidatus Epulopiscium viviparus]
MNTAIYPGSFDPVTIGHIDIIARASQHFTSLIVAIGYNPNKATGLFDLKTRIAMLKLATKKFDNVTVATYDGLLIDFMQSANVNVIVKGVRNSKDFEYEKDMALINNSLDITIETFLLFANPMYSFISSSMVRELLYFNKEVDNYVPKEIIYILKM